VEVLVHLILVFEKALPLKNTRFFIDWDALIEN
jgi:hypothetical protein